MWGNVGAMKSGPALLKKKLNYQKCVKAFPERAEFYLEQIEQLEEQLTALHACRNCGRPLKGEESMQRGYGPECMKKVEAELSLGLQDTPK